MRIALHGVLVNRQWLFKYLKEQANKQLEYDKDYSAETGDEPPIPVYSQFYFYFDDEGIEHTATTFYKDKQKTIPKSYSFYISGSIGIMLVIKNG